MRPLSAPARARSTRASQSAPKNDENGWPLWITGVDEGVLAGTNGQASSLQLAFGPELFKYFMLGDPSWDYTTYDFATLGSRYGGDGADRSMPTTPILADSRSARAN